MEFFYLLIGRDADPISWWQMCVRALIIFLYALALYRVGVRKLFSSTSAIDIVVMVILGSGLSRALTGNAPLLPTLAATLLLVLLHAFFSWLARHSDLFSRVIKGRPLRLVNNGEIVWHNMRRAQMGERDLREKLRLKGIDDLREVDEALLERNGRLSVFKTRPEGRDKVAEAK